MTRVRGWCFTINNYTADSIRTLDRYPCDYMVYGKEGKGDGKTPHVQGYLYVKNKVSMKTLKKKLSARAHFSKALGTARQNKEYCSKEGDWKERGEMPKDPVKQGHHGDKGGAAGKEYWDEIKAVCKAGDIDDLPSKVFVTQYRTIVAIAKDHATKHKPLPTTTGHWWYGKSGTGKSKTARETYPEAFIKGCNKWWDGYQGEDVVIIEDLDKFNVAMGGDLKRWCDHYSFPAEVKGGGMNIRPAKIIITSQYDISDIWDDKATVDALTRRCKKRKFE